MDLGYFLNQRLAFVEYFHANTTVIFEEVKRKIESGEPPYVDMRDPEYTDGDPAFFEEWERADAAMTLTGATCLDLLQSTFHAFLDAYMRQIGQTKVISQLPKLKQKSWFGNYKVFFAHYLHIDWEASGANLELLEQVILARNDFTHNPDLHSLDSFQADTHAAKYPESAFADRRRAAIGMFRASLIIPDDRLHEAIATIRMLCEYLERERYALPKRLRKQRETTS